MTARNKRIRALLDDKIILGWNALMNTACSKAFEATGNEQYRQMAINNMRFLFEKFAINNTSEFHHTWKNDKAKYPAFLDDYAFLIQALIQLYETTSDTNWLLKAKEITAYVIDHFSETETGFFYFTKENQPDIIVRKKEIYDSAVPSGNSVMAYNLYKLSVFFDLPDWKRRSTDMISSIAKVITRYPTSFGVWNCLLMEIISGTSEIAIVGQNAGEVHKKLLQEFIPHRILMASLTGENAFPLLRG